MIRTVIAHASQVTSIGVTLSFAQLSCTINNVILRMVLISLNETELDFYLCKAILCLLHLPVMVLVGALN